MSIFSQTILFKTTLFFTSDLSLPLLSLDTLLSLIPTSIEPTVTFFTSYLFQGLQCDPKTMVGPPCVVP